MGDAYIFIDLIIIIQTVSVLGYSIGGAMKAVKMKSMGLNSYGRNLKKIAKAKERSNQMQIIQTSRFKASIVDDPLRPSPDLVHVIEKSRDGKSE